MNYYRRFPGDYLRDTMHLSAAEDGMYGRLLDAYYTSEKPLPVDRVRLYSTVRANTLEDQQAVESVLTQFFVKQKAGYVQARARLEIKRCSQKSRKYAANGRKGGLSRQAIARQSLSEGSSKTQASQTLDSRLHTPDKEREEKTQIASVMPLGSPQFKDFFEQYPIQTGRRAALSEWCRQMLDDSFHKVMLSLSKWKMCDRWQDPQYIPYAAKWLSDQWRSEPVKGVSKNEQKRQGTKQAFERVRAELG